MPLPPDEIIPAPIGSQYLRFIFHPATKAHANAVNAETIKRPIVAFRLVADRVVPIVVGLPIDIPEQFDGVEAVAIPGSGMLIEPLTGQAWGSDAAFVTHVVMSP